MCGLCGKSLVAPALTPARGIDASRIELQVYDSDGDKAENLAFCGLPCLYRWAGFKGRE